MHLNKDVNKEEVGLLNPSLIVKLFSMLSVYRLLLDYLYMRFLTPRWGYSGFIIEQPDFYIKIYSWMVLFVVSIILSIMVQQNAFSSIIIQCLLILSFIPGLVIYTFINTQMLSLYVMYWFVLIISYAIFKPKDNETAFKLNVDENILNVISVLFFLFCFFIWGRYAHFHIQTSVIDVYGLREDASNYNMPKLFIYLYAAVQVCVPFMAVWALNRKYWKVFVILSATQILAFFSQGSKSAFFSLIVGVIVHFYISLSKEPDSFMIIKGGIGVTVLTLVENIVIKSNFLLDYIIRRNMFLPNLLNIYFYDYFTTHEVDYFRGSFLRYFGLKSNYDSIPHIIGYEYFNSTAMYANNGLFSDAYSNLGSLGVFVMPLIIVLLLRLFDRCIGNVSLDIKIGAAVYVVFCLIGSSLFTNLLTHGFIMLAIIFCCLDKENQIVLT